MRNSWACLLGLLLLPQQTETWPVLVGNDGNVSLLSAFNVRLLPGGPEGEVRVGRPDTEDTTSHGASLVFMGEDPDGNIRMHPAVGTRRPGTDLSISPGSGTGDGIPGAIYINTPRRHYAASYGHHSDGHYTGTTEDVQRPAELVRLQEDLVEITGSLNVSGTLRAHDYGLQRGPLTVGSSPTNMVSLSADHAFFPSDKHLHQVTLRSVTESEAVDAGRFVFEVDGATKMVLRDTGADLDGELFLGSDPYEGFVISSQYAADSATLDYVAFTSRTGSGAAGRGRLVFNVDEVPVATMKDAELELLGDLHVRPSLAGAAPAITLGPSQHEALVVSAAAADGKMDHVTFETRAHSHARDKGKMKFKVDESLVLTLRDEGVDVVGDVTVLSSADDANPSVLLGASKHESLKVTAVYEDGDNTLEKVTFETRASSSSPDRGKMQFKVDEDLVLTVKDMGIAVEGMVSATSSISSSGSVTAVGVISSGADIQVIDASNYGNPSLTLGASATEALVVSATYDSGAQTLDYVKFETKAASGAADKGKMVFNVDGMDILTVQDSGVAVAGGIIATPSSVTAGTSAGAPTLAYGSNVVTFSGSDWVTLPAPAAAQIGATVTIVNTMQQSGKLQTAAGADTADSGIYINAAATSDVADVAGEIVWMQCLLVSTTLWSCYGTTLTAGPSTMAIIVGAS